VTVLQAMARVQYVAGLFVLFTLVFPGRGMWAAAASLELLLSPLEAENYVLAFLAHHSASAAIVVLSATMLLPVGGRLAVLQGVGLLYIGLTYIEVLAPVAVIMGAQMVWRAWREMSMRPLFCWGAVCLGVLLTFSIREPGMLSRFVAGLAAGNGAGFPVLGVPDGIAGNYVAALASLHAGIIGLSFPGGWTRVIPVLVSLGLFCAGLWIVLVRRGQVWILVAILFVVAAHFDRVALLRGELRLMEPYYQGPKAYLYFHFLWIAVTVGGAMAVARRSIRFGALLLAVWLVPVVVLGAGFAVRLAQWPAVWTAHADLLIAQKLSGDKVTLVGTRPSEEKLWKQLAAYTGQPIRINAAGSSGQQIVARHRYATRGGAVYSFSGSGTACPAPLAESNGFVLCGSAPGFTKTEFRLRGQLESWDAEWQPLLTCGTTGDAIFFGLKKSTDGQAVLTIDEWGIPTVFGGSIPVRPRAPFELFVRLGRASGEVSAEHESGGRVFHKLVSNTKLGACEAVIGTNEIGATTVSKKFHGELTDNPGPQR